MQDRWAVQASATIAGLMGAIVGMYLWNRICKNRRSHLPKRIILVRHGESEGNADHTLYRTKADNLIELTTRGMEQARALGGRLKCLLGNDRVHLVVSPFERTLQTARFIRDVIEDNIIRLHIEPRVREQEFGNLQGDEFKSFRAEQQRVGRFFYRFPTGESGADVYGRAVRYLLCYSHHSPRRPLARALA